MKSPYIDNSEAVHSGPVPSRVRLYYITDRAQLGGTEQERCEGLLAKIGEAARAGVDYIQLREKDLTAGALERLACQAVRVVRNASETTKLLINSRVDVAIAVDADGVHLTSTDISAGDARAVFRRECVIDVSCHTLPEVKLAYSQGADFVVFAPVFEKVSAGLAGTGLDMLRAACASVRMPVLALGGITVANASACVHAGAAGVAGIRLFQDYSAEQVVRMLRSLA